jgi:rubrerythrin
LRNRLYELDGDENAKMALKWSREGGVCWECPECHEMIREEKCPERCPKCLAKI